MAKYWNDINLLSTLKKHIIKKSWNLKILRNSKYVLRSHNFKSPLISHVNEM
jgi:hypothetical protein